MLDTKWLENVCAKVAKGEMEPLDGFQALDHALSDFPGHKLFTVLAIDWHRAENLRVYTSEPGAYPNGGAKPLNTDSDFYRKVISAGATRLCRTRDECRAAFFDFALIEQLGCESAVNVPVRVDGQTIGSLNLLHQAGWYTEEMLPTLERIGALAAALLMPLLSPQKRTWQPS